MMAQNNKISTAMMIMVVAMLLVPGLDAAAKLLATKYNLAPASIVFARFAVQALLLFVFLAITRGSIFIRAKNPLFNMLRGFLHGFASVIFFVALKYMPLADAISIFFVEPMILMFLSRIFLNETLGWRRVVAALVGFGGALLVIQPSFEIFGTIALLPLVSAVAFSFYLLLTRKYGSEDDVVTMQFYAGLGGAMLAVIVMTIGETAGIADLSMTLPTHLPAVALLVLVGVIATLSHLMIAKAFTMAPAAILAPFQYVEIVSATILGLLMFDNFPNALKWLGITIIILSGLFIFWRERQVQPNAG